MIVPNTQRVLIKPVTVEDVKIGGGIVIPGQQKAGENLLYGEIIHPGDTRFKKGQFVYYSEYSAATIIDFPSLVSGAKTFAEITKEEGFVIVAEDDIMAYDAVEVPDATKKD